MQPFFGRDWQMRHGSRHDSGRRHSADTLRSRSGAAGGGRGSVRRSSCESEEEGWESKEEDG